MQKFKKFLKELRFYTLLFIAALVLAAAMRVFLFTSIIRIPSDSMEPAVMAGDFIIANKQIPGPRVFKDVRQIRIDGKVQTKRFKGIRVVRRNDVLVFNFPYSGSWDRIDMALNIYYLKRCVALPGDTFLIDNYATSAGCTFRQLELEQMSRDDFQPDIWDCFPFDSVHYRWNIKDFGPLYVPEAGATIAVDTLNVRLYKNLIEYETDKKLSVSAGLVYLDDELLIDYTFRMNYYFMAGDNVFNSQDSRYWGLLPEDCIIGKAVIVVKSVDPRTGKYRWGRFMKAIK